MRFLLAIVLFAACFAEEELPRSAPEQIASSRRDFLIADLISPFSGQLVLQERDMEVIGAEPLFVERTFNPYCLYYSLREGELPSSTSFKRNSDWKIFPHLYLYVQNRIHYRVTDASGITLDFKTLGGENPKLWQDSYGICNACGDTVSGKYDVRNTKLTLNDQGNIHVQRPDGTEQFYQTRDGRKFVLQREILPNGKVIRYYYRHDGELYVVESQDPHNQFTYARLNIDKGWGKFSSSTQEELLYQFENKLEPKVVMTKNGFSRPVLTTVSSVFYPSETYSYNEELLLQDVQGKKVDYSCGYAISGAKDIPVGHHHYRVRGLRFKGEEECCYLTYTLPKAGRSSGETIVSYKDGLRVVYEISPLMLPSTIQWWDKNELKKEKKFNWSSHQWLDSVVVTDGKNSLYEKKFTYDRFGNPIEELFIDHASNESYLVKRIFSQDGKQLLLSEENEEGKVVQYTYLAKTNLVTSKRTYDRGHLLIEEVMDYDPSYNLIQKTVRGSGTQHKVTRYTLRQQNPFLHMPEIVQELYVENDQEIPLTKVNLHYDQWGHVAKEDWHDAKGILSYSIERTYNGRGDLLSETDPLGNKAAYHYDEKGRCIKAASFSNRLVTHNNFDSRGRLIGVEKVGDHASLQEASYRYDLNDSLVEKEDRFGHKTFYTNDPLTKKAVSTQFPAGNVTTHAVYDCLGRKVEQIDGNGQKTTSTYNSFDLPLTITHPDGTCEQFTYTKTGKLKSSTDEEGKTTHYEYDVLGRVVSKKTNALEEYWVYDAFDLISYTDAEGNVTDYFYDGAGRKIKEASGPKTTLYSYDDWGHLSEIRSNDFLVKTFKRDLKGQILEEIDALIDGSIVLKILRTYDPEGNCLSETKFVENQPATDHFLFDPFNRLIQAQDPLRNVTTYCYDDHFINHLGQKVLKKTTIDPRSVQTIEIFDTLDRLAKKETISSTGVQFSYSFGYDSCDNLLSRTNDLSGVADCYTYDRRNRTEKLVRAFNSPLARETSYTYTPSGKLATKTLPDNVQLSFSYDENGYLQQLRSSDGTINHHLVHNKLGILTLAEDRLTGISVSREVDRFGNILKETFGDGRIVSMSYNAFDQLKEFHFDHGTIAYNYEGNCLKEVNRLNPNGELLYTHTYDLYDTDGRLLEESLIGGVKKAIYAYDLCGRKVSHQGELLSYDSVGNLIRKQETSYEYDPLSQLIREGKSRYRYDHQGNRNEKFLFNPLDELAHISYDLRGNPTQQNGFFYTYDALDRLIEATNSIDSVKFSYDPLGRVYSRVSNGTKEHYLYMGEEEIGSSVNGELKTFKVIGLHNLPVAIELDHQIYAPQVDHQRNITALIDIDTKEPAFTYAYTAFGEETSLPDVNPWHFSSKRLDPFLQLINYGHRFYDPSLGRWHTQDPIGFADGYNLYQYLHNNPYRYFDPNGQFAFAIPLVTFFFGAAEVSAVIITVAQICEAAVCATAVFYGTKYIYEQQKADVIPTTTVQVPVEDETNPYEKRSTPNGPDKAAEGNPHTTIEELGPGGKYTTYEGGPGYKQYRGSGKPHGDIPRPNVKEVKVHQSPYGPMPGTPTVRPPRLDEIPKGK